MSHKFNQKEGRVDRNKDLVEFVYLSDTGTVECVSVSNHTVDKMHKILETTLSHNMDPLDQRILLLDLHGVVDTVDVDQPLSTHPICVISFLGANSDMRNFARADLSRRILSKQINIGCMVFARPKIGEVIGERVVKSNRGKIITSQIVSNHDDRKIVGSKAWLINLIDAWSPGVKKAFIDDGQDHVAVVCEYCSPSIVTRFLTRDMDIVKTIKNL